MLSLALAGPQIKHFKMVLQCLNKIGTELLMEATQSKLKLQAINTSKSAFFAITFDKTFFESFTTNGVQVVQAGVLLKHVLAAMKTSKVLRMQMEVDPQTYQIIICIESQNGLVKRYRLESMQSDILDANLQRDDFPITVVAEAAELGRLLSTFQHSQEEITIIANPDTPEHTGPWHHACQLQSFLDPKKARSGSSLQTSMTVDAHSVFRHYSHQAGETCDVTFNLRDLRAMVVLCEHMQANVTIRIDKCGVPLLVEPHFSETDHPGYSAELILATLVESQIGAAMPMPQDVIPQQPPDLIGQQQEPQQGLEPQQLQLPPQQRVGSGAHQGGTGIVRFNHQGGDEQAGFEGVEAEEEVVLQETGIQPRVEPAGPPGGAATPPFARGTTGAAGMGLSLHPHQPPQHAACPQEAGTPSASYGLRKPMHQPAPAVSDLPPFPFKPVASGGHGRMSLHGSMGPRSVGSAYGHANHEQGGYGRVSPPHAGAPHQPLSNGGVPPSHGDVPNQPFSHGRAAPSFAPAHSSWKSIEVSGDRQPHRTSPQPLPVQQRQPSAASGGDTVTGADDSDMPLMGLDDPEHLPGARSPSPFRSRGLGSGAGPQPAANPYQANNNSTSYNDTSRIAKVHGTHHPGAAAGRASGSITFPQLKGASRYDDGIDLHVPYLLTGQACGVSGMAAAPGYQQYAQQQQQQLHQLQQQQQQPTVEGGGAMAVDDDDDDDVLPGTPEEEQPANDREGPSIIGMGVMGMGR